MRSGGVPVRLGVETDEAGYGLALLRLNVPGFPWPGPLEQMADQAVTRLIGLDTQADGHPA